jgi:FkbM family methyltransferase
MLSNAPMPMPMPTPWLDRLQDARSVQSMLEGLRQRHPAFVGPRRIAILGAAAEGRRLVGLCRKAGLEAVALVDDDPALRGAVIDGVAVTQTEALDRLDRAIPVIIASHRTLKATERLKGLGFMHVAPFALLQLLDPLRFPPQSFYASWLEDLFDNRSRYGHLASVLGDDFSRRVLDAIIGYRLTCDPLLLAPIVEWDLYGPADLLNYGEHEVFIDGGSFDGDTVKLFVDRVHDRYDRVLAFEPDPATFAKLRARFDGEKRVEPINRGLYSRSGALHFNDEGSRASGLVSNGTGTKVEVTSIDEVLRGEPVTYIKMNIEGAEQEALRGAAASITRWRPKLAISAYHRAQDLWQIPELVREIHAGYRLFLRQHDGGVIETVLYALP